jgi:hypothetical protein
MATIRFTDEDRDERGFVAVPVPPRNPEPRSLADLLPSVAAPPDQAIKRNPPAKAEVASMIGLGIFLIALLGYLWSSGDSPRIAPLPRPAATQASRDSAAKPSPLPATAPAVAGRLLIAFASPDGEVLGAIESTRAITPTAHYGDTWIQADVAGSGLVWLRASDSPDLAIVGPDLSPRRPAAAVPAAAPPSAPFVPAVPTAPPPPPTQCAEAGIPGKMVSSCGYEELSVLEAQAKDKWLATYGGNIGTVSTPSPQIGR